MATTAGNQEADINVAFRRKEDFAGAKGLSDAELYRIVSDYAVPTKKDGDGTVTYHASALEKALLIEKFYERVQKAQESWSAFRNALKDDLPGAENAGGSRKSNLERLSFFGLILSILIAGLSAWFAYGAKEQAEKTATLQRETAFESWVLSELRGGGDFDVALEGVEVALAKGFHDLGNELISNTSWGYLRNQLCPSIKERLCNCPGKRTTFYLNEFPHQSIRRFCFEGVRDGVDICYELRGTCK